jgi:ferrochelatase
MGTNARPVGVLLVQLGTPDSPSVRDVRRYLREFLSDPSVIDLPAPARWLLLYAVILPFRPRRSAHAYAQIWRQDGSPLRVHSATLRDAVAERLGPGFRVELGMRYGQPSIADALHRLAQAEVARTVVLPLFPQFAPATTGSILECVARAAHTSSMEIVTIESFWDRPGFEAALTASTRRALEATASDHLLLSYHGLPERQIKSADLAGAGCLERMDCCATLSSANARCYRAQCFAASHALAAALDLAPDEYSTSFQSRFGRTPWIRPYTDDVLAQLAARGVKRLTVACPSFVADCLETLEEIGIRARARWLGLGGEELNLIPCLNADPLLAEAVAGWVREVA